MPPFRFKEEKSRREIYKDWTYNVFVRNTWRLCFLQGKREKYKLYTISDSPKERVLNFN